MAGKKRDKVTGEQLESFKYVKLMAGLLEELHEAGCQRDRAGNRTLHMDQYVMLLLMYMFNPICTSLQAIQEASELKKVQRLLGVSRASMGSLSEATHIFDSELLRGVIGKLVEQLRPIRHDSRLDELRQIITLVDGSWLPALAQMTWANFRSDGQAAKLHLHYELLTGVPVSATITDAKTDEKAVLAEHLESGRLYVMDRGYAKYELLLNILDAGSGFVCRIRDNAVFEVLEEHELSAEALAAGVVRDAVVRLGGEQSPQLWGRRLRIVEVQCTPHNKKGKTARGGPGQGDTILIVTDHLDESPDVIALVYQNRWAIEIFFRFYKHILGCRHLLSHNKNGIELQTYAAIIACLLIALWTGRKPTLKTYRMLCWYFSGLADIDELLEHLRRLPMQEMPVQKA
jgi:hypothetical protein